MSDRQATLRDEFAMSALTGLLGSDLEYSWKGNSQGLAQEAYIVADAMMRERAVWAEKLEGKGNDS